MSSSIVFRFFSMAKPPVFAPAALCTSTAPGWNESRSCGTKPSPLPWRPRQAVPRRAAKKLQVWGQATCSGIVIFGDIYIYIYIVYLYLYIYILFCTYEYLIPLEILAKSLCFSPLTNVTTHIPLTFNGGGLACYFIDTIWEAGQTL